jgi:hypothetical protein
VNAELSTEALAFGATAVKAFEAAGGDELLHRAEADPSARAESGRVLADLGAWDLRPRGSDEELEAAAALCRAAGWWGIPVPVAEMLAKPTDLEVDGLVVVDPLAPSARLAGTTHPWAAVALDGRRSRVVPRPPAGSPRTTAFVTELELEPVDELGAGDLALALVLPCWTLLGMLDRALDLTCAYVQDRHQFGQPLSSFQSVQFQLTDAEVERVGLEELAKHALWSVQVGQPDAVADALALRAAAIEAAEVTFRICHQLHGAIGFCDETALSWLSRHSQPLRRLPFGLSATRDHLVRAVGRQGLSGLFS